MKKLKTRAKVAPGPNKKRTLKKRSRAGATVAIPEDSPASVKRAVDEANRLIVQRLATDAARSRAEHVARVRRALAEVEFVWAVDHRTPRCCRGDGAHECDGGCLTDRPEITWAAGRAFNLAIAQAKLAGI